MSSTLRITLPRCFARSVSRRSERSRRKIAEKSLLKYLLVSAVRNFLVLLDDWEIIQYLTTLDYAVCERLVLKVGLLI